MKEENKSSKVDKSTSGLTREESITQDIKKQESFGDEIIESKITFFKKILGGSETKLIQNYRLKLVNVLSDAKVENVRMVKEAERQVLKEALEWILTQGKIKTRKVKGIYFDDELRDYVDKMANSSAKFWDGYILKKNEIGELNDEEAKEGRLRQLRDLRDLYENSIRKLIKEFESILNEGV